MHLLRLNGVPILQQLYYEEALLRADQRNWCIINRGSPPAIVMGISGRPSELINQQYYSASPVPVIKRFSGGGTVFVDENTFFVTFICNAASQPISPYPESIMRWTEKLYRPFFHPHPFSLRENDYTLAEKKFGGNAQSIIKNRWLHHSSFLWDYHPDRMNYLLMPPKMPTYRQARPHAEFLCKLSDYWPCLTEFEKAFLDNLRLYFDFQEVGVNEIDEVIKLPHRKATTLLY